MNLTTEFLQNVKIIKMYAWEKIFLKLIGERRDDELKVLAKVQKLSTISTTFLYFFPSLLQTCTFSGAIYYNGHISLGEAFLILNIFRILKGPMDSLPSFVGAALNFLVSMKRIQDFLLCDEVDHNLIENGDGDQAVEIKEGSSFHWGFEKKEVEEVTKKKKTKAVKGKKDDNY
jgi:ATP-binding cassette subfamily C (CFTR/MRP) protein 1